MRINIHISVRFVQPPARPSRRSEPASCQKYALRRPLRRHQHGRSLARACEMKTHWQTQLRALKTSSGHEEGSCHHLTRSAYLHTWT